MPPTVGALTDAQLRALLPSKDLAQHAVEELTRRYGDVILACVLELCATADDARELAAEAVARTVDAHHRGSTPGPSWIVSLLGEARHLAARRAETGRRGTLSPGFLDWFDEGAGAHPGDRAARCAAEDDSPLLRSLATLTDPQAAQLWRALVAPPGPDAPPPDTRRTLADAYLRLFVATVPDRRCRHLAVPLSESAAGSATGSAAGSGGAGVAGSAAAGVGEDAPVTVDLARHLARCPRCGRALEDLAAVHRWDVDLLRSELFGCSRRPSGRPGPAETCGGARPRGSGPRFHRSARTGGAPAGRGEEPAPGSATVGSADGRRRRGGGVGAGPAADGGTGRRRRPHADGRAPAAPPGVRILG
ncbi:hypothetical protein [Streptomyces sp. NRRL S-495]|uniref:hypothetical protein n=1 Tax=Streptomyces sp. NRRL S-495 TaxID=1609133 RepID=UPI0005F8E407|nr:hypothetical protein [Streptomyces sp. NRRL S-495]KJY25114.1 hypothetical protein VR45_39900 [Streptomyces sp. NRRL S-495]